MLAIVTVQMKDGRLQRKVRTTRDAIRDFFNRRKDEIEWLIADINLIRWYYHCDAGWFKKPKFKYIPNRPDLWRQVP